MAGSSDNVIPFPGPDSLEGSPEDRVKQLVHRLIDEGHDPRELLGQLLAFGAPDDLVPGRRQPEVAPAPEVVRQLRIRVDLEGAKPPIWRRLEVAGDLRLSQLHEVLQVAMGWTNSHLHQFLVGPRFETEPFVTDYAESEGDEGILERDVRLDQVLREAGDRLVYEYDFGDGWDHVVRLERVEEYDGTRPPARVTGGRRACPPEDCGGMGGYDELLALRADPGSADEWGREQLAWLGDDFDPEAFSAEETDQLLQHHIQALALVRPEWHGDDPALSPALRELAERLPDPTTIGELVGAAGLADAAEVDAETKARMMRPWLHLLNVVGSGVALTAAEWLPPAMVQQLCADLDLLEPWMGKGNREQNLPPVRVLRSSAVSMGLLRKIRRNLEPTTKGLRARTPEAMWDHVVASLPVGKKDHQRHAGTIMLLAVAAGSSAYDGITTFGPTLLWDAGWMVDHEPPTHGDVIEWARPTWDVLRVLEGPGRRPRQQPADELRQLARAALRV